MNEQPTIAVLCAARNTAYRTFDGVEVYDERRDARTFPGGMPVIAHPPCRLWSAYLAHQAKSPDPGKERELGVWCAEQVRTWGGVLEQPAHSRLWDAARLPKPGWTTRGDQWSMEISQFWWGDTPEKSTWLYFVGIRPDILPQMAFRLKRDGECRRTWQLMSKNERSRTPVEFASWLIACARIAKESAIYQQLTQ